MLTINVNAILPRQMLTTKLSAMHFAMVRLDNRNLWDVEKSIFWRVWQILMLKGEISSWWVQFWCVFMP